MRASQLSSLIIVSSLLAACAAPLGEDPDCEECDDQAANRYVVELGGEYAFCLAPVEPSDEDKKKLAGPFMKLPLPNLESVRFLTHMSDVAYWEPVDMGPELERLGFGKPGDGQTIADCGSDAAIIRDSASDAPLIEEVLSSCARDWVERTGSTEASEFLRYVEGEVKPELDIEFFSAGYEAEADGDYVRGSTQLVWAKHRTEPWVVIAFRGTEFPDGADIWTDGNFPTVPFIDALPEWGRVHGGFNSAFRSVSHLLDQRLSQLDPNTKIWVTGHSLGGALASLFSAELLARVDRGVALEMGGMVTLGSPRVGDTAFFEQAEAIAAERGVSLVRVQNVSEEDELGYDPIVHVPFREAFGEDFGHVGAPLQLFDHPQMFYGEYESRNPFDVVAAAIQSFKDRILTAVSEAFPHLLVHYVDRLDQVIESRSSYTARFRQCGPRP